MKRQPFFKIFLFCGIVLLSSSGIVFVSYPHFFNHSDEEKKEFFLPKWEYPTKYLSFPKSDSRVIAHRGFQKNTVENTLESLQTAIQFKPAYVEVDIQQTKDNYFVVIHDTSLRRLAHKKNKIRQLTLAELKKIKLKQNNVTGYIPTLEEVISLAKSQGQPLLLDIKTSSSDSMDMPQDLITLLEKYQVTSDYLIQSQDDHFLNRLKELSPSLQVGLVIKSLPSKDFRDYQFVALRATLASDEFLAQQRTENRTVYLWTVDFPSEMDRMMKKSVMGIITDDLDNATRFSNVNKLESTYLERIRLNQLERERSQSRMVP
ncbi:glycerophosphodiester phosphodiesterase family protein [Carnobacterium gallinarum]|uniref:glycerophosphodiester phosphodiesterase family protein n=1 Tax=Carnobacterium gallinarum TaxID=2749 RepID=UPI000553248E|nr:glycerophosphodiester phosphodiesterase family protein [Carnobacterium gallinarum]